MDSLKKMCSKNTKWMVLVIAAFACTTGSVRFARFSFQYLKKTIYSIFFISEFHLTLTNQRTTGEWGTGNSFLSLILPTTSRNT